MNMKLTVLVVVVGLCMFTGSLDADLGGAIRVQNKTAMSHRALVTDDCDCCVPSDTLPSYEHLVMKDPLFADRSPEAINDDPIAPGASLPDYFNWKDIDGEDWTTPAKNQGNCGSCWDFAACGAFEGVIKIREGNARFNPDLSEQYVLSCLPAAANHYGQGCRGGNPTNAYYYMFNTSVEGNYINGALLERCFPYRATHTVPCSEKSPDWEGYVVPLAGMGEAWLGPDSLSNREILKTQVMQNGPVAAAMNVEAGFGEWGSIHHDSADYFPDPGVPWRNSLNHIIVIVGWRNDVSIDNGGYWICKNSWGTAWGYGGFFNIEYGALFTGYLISWAEYDPASFDCPPTADAGSFYQGTVHDPIWFDGTNSTDAEGTILSYSWDFGDGTNGTGSVISHTYARPGYYTASLTVTDESNRSSTDTVMVGVDEPVITISRIEGGRRFVFAVHNNHANELTYLTWNLTLTGLIIGTKERHGTIYSLPAGDEYVFEEIIIGIGPGSATLAVGPVSETVRIFMLGPFVVVRPLSLV
jgi:hypothetical protein